MKEIEEDPGLADAGNRRFRLKQLKVKLFFSGYSFYFETFDEIVMVEKIKNISIAGS